MIWHGTCMQTAQHTEQHCMAQAGRACLPICGAMTALTPAASTSRMRASLSPPVVPITKGTPLAP